MRSILRLGLIVVVLLGAFAALLLFRVKPPPKPERPVPQIAYSEDDFREPSAHKTNDITLLLGRKLTVNLDLNPTIPFTWETDVANSDPTVLRQVSLDLFNNPLPPGVEPMPARGSGTFSWTFEPLKAGTTTLQFKYGSGDTNHLEGRRSLQLTVNVQ